MSGDAYGVRTDELALQGGLAILREHGDDLLEVGVKLVERFALRMRAGKTGHVSDVEPCLGVSFDHGRVRPHVTRPEMIRRENSADGRPSGTPDDVGRANYA